MNEAARLRRFRRENPERAAEYRHRYKLKAKYGLTVEAYDAMLAGQGNACAICEEQCATGRRLAVDHCHDTGRVRGLLCVRCNRAVGLLMDDPERADSLATYLRRA